MVKRHMYEKEDWVIKYLNDSTNIGIDMLNERFVDDYVEEFKAKHKVMMWGANKCPELGILLRSMYDQGILKRVTVGITEAPPGMPKWVYVYSLTDLGQRM